MQYLFLDVASTLQGLINHSFDFKRVEAHDYEGPPPLMLSQILFVSLDNLSFLNFNRIANIKNSRNVFLH